MKTRPPAPHTRESGRGTFSRGVAGLPDLLIALGVGSILLAAMGYLSVYSARSFSALGNYEDMATRSRQAIEIIGRKFNEGSSVTDIQPNLPVKSVTVVSPVAPGSSTLTWDSQARTLTLTANAKNRVLLSGCDSFDVRMFTRAPVLSSNSISNTPTTDPKTCKLIKLTWQCSRINQGKLVNTEAQQKLDIVLRNKLN
jgi:hypothetical protein